MSPNGLVFEVSLYCALPPDVLEILNPFTEPNRIDVRYLKYIGNIKELNEIKRKYDVIAARDGNAAIKYIRQTYREKSKLNLGKTFLFVMLRPLAGFKWKDLIPDEWRWILERELDDNDFGVFDMVILGGSTKYQLDQWKKYHSLKPQTKEEITFFPKCLLIRGNTQISLQNEGHLYL